MRPLMALAGASALALFSTNHARAQAMADMPGMNTPRASKPAPKTPVRKAARPAQRKAAAAPPVRRSAAPPPSPAPTVHAGHQPDPAPAEASHSDHAMPGMDMGAQQPSQDHQGHAMPSTAMPAEGAGVQVDSMPGMDMTQGRAVGMDHDMAGMPAMTQHGAGGTGLAPGNAPAPAPPSDHYADRVFGAAGMAESRALLQREHGGGKTSFVSLNIAEYQIRDGEDGYRWDGEAWYGGDLNRLTIKSEGEGMIKGGKAFMETAEVQGLFSRALDPYWNLQAGVRYDFKPNPSRTYATLGIEGVAPYWWETEAAIFVSNKGEVLGRIEGYYDQRITQRLILQPRVEINLSAQDVPETRIGAGISNIELGLRLRYELKREFAPYVGISYDRRLGQTANYARADGESVSATSLVIGIRTWF